MAKFLPPPEGFSDNPAYTEFGYYWNCSVWGTKWDVFSTDIFESGATITIIYETAWDPNADWVMTLCRYISNMSFSLNDNENKEIYVTLFYVRDFDDYGSEIKWTPQDGHSYIENIYVTNQISALYGYPEI